MKKQYLAAAMAVVMAFSLAGCSGSKTEATAAESKTEAATTAGESKTETTAAGAESKAAGETTEAASTGKKLIMGTNAEFPPYEFHEGGEIVGIDVEIAAAVAKKLGMELQVEDMKFDAVIPAVQAGKIDIGAAGMTVTEERLLSIDFTDTYAEAAQVIIVPKDSPIATPDDLKDKKIGVQLGTTGDLYAGDIEGATIEQYNKGMEAVMSLTQNKVDAVIIDREPAKVFVKENEGLKILDEAFTEEEYAIAVKKGNTELVNQINGALKELKDSGELQKIVDKYITAE